MSNNKKTVAYVWNGENHHSWQEATSHGVCETIEIDSTNQGCHIEHLRQALLMSNRFTDKMSITLVMAIVHLKSYSVSAEVLEWNQYSVDVWAASRDDAKRIAKDEGILSFSSNDVTWGSSVFEDGEPTSDRNHTVYIP